MEVLHISAAMPHSLNAVRFSQTVVTTLRFKFFRDAAKSDNERRHVCRSALDSCAAARKVLIKLTL